MAQLLGHRQTKETATDKPNLLLPRHIPTLPNSAINRIAESSRPARQMRRPCALAKLDVKRQIGWNVGAAVLR
jgi:hypothetical protein